MATVPIRDILDNETGEPIFPRTHVKAVIGLADSNFFEEYVDGNGARSVKLRSDYVGLWAEGWIANGGVGTGGGGGGGLITSVYGASYLGSIYSPTGVESLTETFSAFAIDKVWQAVVALQQATPNVSLSNGSAYSTITVNGTVADFYTKAQVDGLISGINSFEPVPVQSLPTASADTMYKLYLVPSDDPQSQNIKDEYITYRTGSAGNYTDSWEKVGSTAIDITGYVTLSGAQTITGGKTFSGGIVMDGADIVPSSNNTSGIGTSSARFAGIYGVNADLSGGLSLAQTGHIDIGPARIEYDATNGAIHVTTNQIGNNAPAIGFYMDGFLASGGIGNGGGGGYGVEEITSNEDGTVDFHFTGGDVTTVDLNHEHPQYNSKLAETTQPSGGFLPDVVYELGTLTGSVTFALASAVSGQVNHYFWTFTAGSTAPTITWPSGITWADSAPTITASKKYQISILDGIAAFMEA